MVRVRSRVGIRARVEVRVSVSVSYIAYRNIYSRIGIRILEGREGNYWQKRGEES